MDQPTSTPSRATLEYATPATTRRYWWFAVPISWPFALLLFAIWTWPFWYTLNSFGMFVFDRMIHVFYAFIGVLLVVATWAARNAFVSVPLVPDAKSWRSAIQRMLLVIVVSLGFIVAHACIVPQRLLFALQVSAFERARLAATNTLPANAGSTARHQPIGIYAVNAVRRGPTGEIGFHAGDSAIGSSFVWSPSGSQPDPVFYPPDAGGHLWGNWYWWATD